MGPAATLVGPAATLVGPAATLVGSAFNLVIPDFVLTSGFATRAFLVAARLLINDFFWIAIERSSECFWVSATAQPTMSISLAKAQPAKLPGAVLGNQAVRDGELAKGLTNSTGRPFFS